MITCHWIPEIQKAIVRIFTVHNQLISEIQFYHLVDETEEINQELLNLCHEIACLIPRGNEVWIKYKIWLWIIIF